jgi:outer membrane protein assembly factor BamB
MRKRLYALVIIALSISIALFLSACGDNGTGGRIGGGIDGGIPDGGGTPEGGLPEPVAGTLSGSVWHDLNQDQVIDPGEPGIPGIEVDLYIDTNENGEYDVGVDELISTTTTNSNGDYSFSVTSTGRYFIEVSLLQPTIFGWVLTTNTDEPAFAMLRVDVLILDVGIKDLNFGFVNLTLWGFDISNGSPIDIVSSPAIATDGTIYIGSGNGALYAINPDGTLKWKYETGGALPASPAIGSDGTVYIGSMDRQFYAINPDGTLKWIFPTETNFTSSAAIGADGTIYAAGTHQDKIIFPCVSDSSCFITTPQACGGALPPCPTGQICADTACAIPTGQACSPSDPCPVGQTCVSGQPVPFTVTTRLGILFAINPNGTEKWQYMVNKSGFSDIPGLSGFVHSSPAVASDGTIYIGTLGDVPFDRSDFCDKTSDYPASDAHPAYPVNGHLYAINPNGTLKWDFKTLGAVFSSPAIGSDGTVYVGSERTRKLYGMNNSILVDQNPSTEGFVYAINQNGTIKWFVDLLGDVDSSPAIGSDGTVYVGADNFHVYALNPANGATIWVVPTRDMVKSSPAVASDGVIYIGSNDGSLYAFNPDGTLNMRYIKEAGSVNSSPSIGTDGTVYFATEGGFLFALLRTSPLANAPWPKFRHDLLNTGRK